MLLCEREHFTPVGDKKVWQRHALNSGVQDLLRGPECVDIRIYRFVWRAEKFSRRKNAFELAGIHKGNAVTQHQRFCNVMRDKNDRFAQRFSELQKFVLQLRAGDGIKRTKGFVHEQNCGISGKRPCQSNSLSLAARKLVWISASILLERQSHQVQYLTHARCDPRSLPALQFRNQRDIFFHGVMRKKPCFLDGVTDVTAKLNHVPVGSGTSVNKHFTFTLRQKTIDELERRGLA